MSPILSIASALLCAVLLKTEVAAAKTPQHGSAAGHSHARPPQSSGRGKAVPGVRRDRQGNIKRSTGAKADFQKSHPCPATGQTTGRCPGYVIDHVKPLKRGGADSPGNMQWQTKRAAKFKDKTE